MNIAAEYDHVLQETLEQEAEIENVRARAKRRGKALFGKALQQLSGESDYRTALDFVASRIPSAFAETVDAPKGTVVSVGGDAE